MSDQERVELLMNEVLPFAKEMLANSNGFHPFGGYLDSQGDVVHVGVDVEEALTSQGKVEVIGDSFRRLAVEKKAIAFAIVTDVRISGDAYSGSDAVHIFLEDKSGYCAEVFFCYELSGSELKFTHEVAQRGTPRFFSSDVSLA